MKCPLLDHYEGEGGVAEKHLVDDCLRWECAWWNGDNNRCAIYLLAMASQCAAVSINDVKSAIQRGQPL